MTRPSFTTTIEALRTTDARFPWVGPAPDEDDVAALLELIQDTHQGDADYPDHRGQYGRCSDCHNPWPCTTWVDAEHLAVQYLGRAADRVIAHATGTQPHVERTAA